MITVDAGAPMVSPERFVERVRTFAPIDGHARHEWLPDGRTTLVFRVLDNGQRGDVCAAGPRTRALFKDLRGVTRAATFQLKPGWAASVLGVAANALTDRIVPLEDIWGRAGSELYRELLAAHELPELVACVSSAIAIRAQHSFEPAAARLARRAVRLIEGGEGRVERVAEQLGVTARHLRRAFTENIGIGPKEFARMARLQRAVRFAENSTDFGRVARDAGYYDQAHFITDFRELIGITPSAFLTRMGERDGRSDAGLNPCPTASSRAKRRRPARGQHTERDPLRRTK